MGTSPRRVSPPEPRQRSQDLFQEWCAGKDGVTGGVGPQCWGTGPGWFLCPGLFHTKLTLPAWKQLGEDAQSVPRGVTPVVTPGEEGSLGLTFGCDGGPRATGVARDILRR